MNQLMTVKEAEKVITARDTRAREEHDAEVAITLERKRKSAEINEAGVKRRAAEARAWKTALVAALAPAVEALHALPRERLDQVNYYARQDGHATTVNELATALRILQHDLS